MSIKHPARSSLPQGDIKCPNCEEYVGPETLVYIPEFGWCCPHCGYADPYFNGG